MNYHFGYSVFASIKKITELGKDHVQPTFGQYDYISVDGHKPEEIPFWTKNPTEVFILQLKNMLSQTKFSDKQIKLSDIERIDIITGGDHGAGAFRCPICIVLKFTDGTYVQTECSIAHIQCKKDNGVVLENTIIDPLGDGLKELLQNPFKLFYNSNGQLKIQ